MCILFVIVKVKYQEYESVNDERVIEGDLY